MKSGGLLYFEFEILKSKKGEPRLAAQSGAVSLYPI